MRHEELMRDAVVRLFMGNGADDGGLAIAPARPTNPRALGGAGFAPVAADQKERGKLFSRSKGDPHGAIIDRLRHHRFRGVLGDPLFRCHRLKESAAQEAVFDHIAHRAFFDFGMVEMHHPGARALAGDPVSHLDLEHRLGLGGNRLPDADRLQKALRGKRQRIGASIKAGVFAGIEWEAVDHADAKARLRQGKGKGRAVEPAADDQDVMFRSHEGTIPNRPGLSMRGSAATVAAIKEDRMQEWLWKSAAELGRGIGKGEIDPVDLARTYLDAIKAHPMRDRIYARLTEDRAMAEARAASARAKSGHQLSPLDGVPISWKDLFDTAGVATEAGTAYLKGRTPERDAEVLRLATGKGLVCLGKTHMTEIAFSGLGYNPITATPPNKVDPEAVPGGSSSGAAASVAFGLAAAGIGTDTGGSVRVPSGWNDLVGLKTTHGRLSLDGVVPLCRTFDTVGPLCRTVEDAALLWDVLGGDAVDLVGADLSRMRLAVLDTIGTEDLEDEPRAAFRSAVARLNDAGAEISHIIFEPLREAFAMAGGLFTADAYAYWRETIEARPELMYHQILKRIRCQRFKGSAGCTS